MGKTTASTYSPWAECQTPLRDTIMWLITGAFSTLALEETLWSELVGSSVMITSGRERRSMNAKLTKEENGGRWNWQGRLPKALPEVCANFDSTYWPPNHIIMSVVSSRTYPSLNSIFTYRNRTAQVHYWTFILFLGVPTYVIQAHRDVWKGCLKAIYIHSSAGHLA